MKRSVKYLTLVLLMIAASTVILVIGLYAIDKQPPNKELVVLLHGIGHTEWNMAGVEFALEREGYEVLNIGYPSTDKKLTKLAAFIDKKIRKEGVWDKDVSKVHFTTHSMGGLVLRAYLHEYRNDVKTDKLGRVVMLAPPLGGSEVADLLEDFVPYKWVFGPAGQELTTAMQLEAVEQIYYELGIIAGNKEWPYLVAAHVIPEDSDGRVAVKKTKIDGMKDHITMSATHSFISWKPSVFKQIVHFLKVGTFNHTD